MTMLLVLFRLGPGRWLHLESALPLPRLLGRPRRGQLPLLEVLVEALQVEPLEVLPVMLVLEQPVLELVEQWPRDLTRVIEGGTPAFLCVHGVDRHASRSSLGYHSSGASLRTRRV